jgi:hypothetical protein
MIVLLAPALLLAQDVLWSTGIKQETKLQYDPSGAGLAVNTNKIIQEIADDMIVPYDAVSISIKATLDARVRKGKDGKPSLAVSFTQLGLSGDTHFRGFPLEEFIQPDRVSFTCRIQKKFVPDSATNIDATELPWYGFDNRFFIRTLPQFAADSDTIIIQNFHMSVTDKGLSKFHERVSLINDYYAACAIFDTLQIGIRQYDFSLTGNYPRLFILLEEMNKILAVIKDKDLENKLKLATYDPKEFRKSYERLSKTAAEMTNNFRDKLKVTSLIYPNDSTDVLVHEFLKGMNRYIRWSMLVSERNSKLYFQYLRDYYTMNAFGKDGPVIRDLVAKVYPGENPNTVMTRISMKIKSSYNEFADQLIREHEYAESVELLKNAKSFAKINPFLKENGGDKKMSSKAANGIYDSYLGIAEFAIENKKNGMARQYLQKAQLYKKEHSPFVTSDSLFNKVVGELVSGNSTHCDSLYAHGKYPEAYDCYREFKSNNDSVTVALCFPNVDKRIVYCTKFFKPPAIAAIPKEEKPATESPAIHKQTGKNRKPVHHIQQKPVRDSLALAEVKKVPDSEHPVNNKPLHDSLIASKSKPVHDSLIASKSKPVHDSLLASKSKSSRNSQVESKIKPAQIAANKPVHDTVAQSKNRRAQNMSVTRATPVILADKELTTDSLSNPEIENPIPHFLASLLSSAVPLIWTDQLKQATKLVDSVALAQNKHGLVTSHELTDAISLYRKKINLKKCWTEKENEEIFLIRAQEKRAKMEFIKGALLLDSAQMCIKKNPECTIPPAGIEDTIKAYAEAVEYQKKLNDVQRFSAPHKEKELVKNLWQTEQYFTTHHIERFGLTNTSTYDAIRDKSNTYLTLQAFQYFRQVQRLQDAFQYLKLLRLQDYPVDKVKDYLQSLGNRMAEKDFKENRTDNLNTRILNYTNGDKWFSRFSDGYKKTWKSRQKMHRR